MLVDTKAKVTGLREVLLVELVLLDLVCKKGAFHVRQECRTTIVWNREQSAVAAAS